MNGKGILYYSISQIAYDGEWCNDQFNGYGILYNENPLCLDEMYDYRDFNNIQDYWIKYEGKDDIIQVTSSMITRADKASFS